MLNQVSPQIMCDLEIIFWIEANSPNPKGLGECINFLRLEWEATIIYWDILYKYVNI